MNLFFTALMFYTRLPVPANIGHNETSLSRATQFFPLIGWIIGGIGAATLWASSVVFSPELAVLLSMIATIYATGAFHEDGFADMCDGFGGGWTKSQILTIMKDSRLGTYGVTGLGLLLAVKFFALINLLILSEVGLVLFLQYVTAHSLSRFIAATVIAALPYAREDLDAKAKPIAQGVSPAQLAVAGAFGLAPLLALVALTQSGWWLLVVPVVAVVRWRLVWLFRKKLGGYTGDCLGATQQLTEIAVYLVFSVRSLTFDV
jgi:adenosylcobinamide-GDP ribazoletransferase